MKVIVGLGNPGEKYEKTRHNLGFVVIEQFLRDYQPVGKTVWEESSKFKSSIAEIEWKPKVGPVEKTILVEPKTYMNNSGLATQLVASFFKVEFSDIWVIYDDVDLPLGAMKIRFGGASAGHRGVESIMETLSTDKFWRFRMGIGHPHRNHNFTATKVRKRGVDDFVLGSFDPSEKGKVRELVKHGAKAIAAALEEGLEVAQNRFNTK